MGEGGDKEQEVETAAARTSAKRKTAATMMKGAARRKKRSRRLEREVEMARGLSNEKHDRQRAVSGEPCRCRGGRGGGESGVVVGVGG